MTDELKFMAYLPRQARSREWILSLLQQLWERGMSYSTDDHPASTWEEQLAAPCHLTTLWGTFYEPLQTGVDHLLKPRGGKGRLKEEQGGAIFADNGVCPVYLEMSFSQNRFLDSVALTVEGNYAEPQATKDALQAPYVANYQAFVEWSVMLCELIQPLFGFGYHDHTLNELEALRDFKYDGGQELLEGHLPQVEQWFSIPPLRYLAPSFLTPKLLLDLLEQPGRWLQRLEGGGVFVAPHHPSYTFPSYSAHLHLMVGEERRATLAKMAHGESPEAPRPIIQQMLREGEAEGGRALEIFQAIKDRFGIQQAEGLLSALKFQAEKLLS